MRPTMSDAVVFDLLRRVALFARVPDADLRAVAKSAHVLARRKGARIFEEGSPAESCYVFTAGRAKVVLSGPGGAEITLGIVQPFELVGDIALLDGSRRSAGLVATEDCRLLQIGREAFCSLRANPAFDATLVVHVTSMLRRATEQLRAIYTYSSSERVCWCLARLAHRAGRKDDGTIILSPRPLHQELADMTGCSRETVTRSLRELERMQWIITRPGTLLLNERCFRAYLEAEEAISDVWAKRAV